MSDTLTSNFSVIFLAAVGISVTIRVWLACRHIRHVLACRDRVPDEFADRVALEAHRKAADYTVAKVRFGFVALAVETLLLLALTLGGGINALATIWQTHWPTLTAGLGLIFSLMLISAVVDLPLAWWRQFVIEARFGFNRMTFQLFLSDLMKSALLAALIGAPVILAVLWLMDTMGSYWWFHVWLFWCCFNLLILFIYPTWIAPLFNKFEPLAEGEVRGRVEALLARCGFHSGGLFVMDGSKRSAHGNAYFTGFGKTKRIVFFDTLLKRLQPAEIEAVLAHELGHFKRRHVVKRIITMFALSLLFLAALGQLISAPWFYAGLGVDMETPGTAVALVLFFLAMPVFLFPLTPLGSMLSRKHEFEADTYAAQHASSDDLVHALVKLYEDNAATLTPDPLHSLFYDSHPPAAIRIAHLKAAAA